MATVVVREAQAADQADLQRVYRRASLSNVGDRDALLAHPQFLVLDPQLIGRGRTRVAMLPNGLVIGFASTSVTAATELELEDLFTDPSWRRRGVARTLVDHIASEALAQGLTRLNVIANEHAMGFYRSCGFMEDGPALTTLGAGVRLHLAVDPRHSARPR